MATEESSRSTTSKDKRSEISRGEPRLPKKVRDAMRETDQYSCIKAILERDTFTTACVILQYSGQETATEEQIAFAAKGLLRSALHDHPEGLKLIRLFGTQKHHWVRRKDKLSARYDASTADLFTSWKAIGSGKELREGEIDLPLGWRSRILFRTFPDAESLNRALSCCPLAQWGPPAQGNEPRHCGLLDSLSGYEGNSAPIMWLQFHDVEWEAGKRLSECVVECVQGPDLYDFKLLASHSCPTHASLSTAEAHRNNLPSFPLRIAWRIENDSPLHSRCSREFARTFDPEFAKELAKDSHLKYSHHLRLRRSPGDFGPDQPSPPPSFLVSSVRGVLRSAMAWLFESLVRDGRLGPPSVTSDYSDKDWAARRQAGEICPVQLLLGGVRQDGQGGFRSTIRLFAKRKSPADDIHGSFISCRQEPPDWKTKDLLFSWQLKSQQLNSTYPGKPLKMETSEFGDALLVTEIQAGPHADKAFVAVCLAMDLISSGFFRLGGFSTRGYGVARCTPLALESMGDLSTALEHGTPPASRSLTGLNHGLNLAREMGFADPLGHLETWLRQLTAPQKSKEAEHALT